MRRPAPVLAAENSLSRDIDDEEEVQLLTDDLQPVGSVSSGAESRSEQRSWQCQLAMRADRICCMGGDGTRGAITKLGSMFSGTDVIHAGLTCNLKSWFHTQHDRGNAGIVARSHCTCQSYLLKLS